MVGLYPLLAKSDYLNANPLLGVDAVMKGLTGPIKVNGTTYNGVMPTMRLSDQDIANVSSFSIDVRPVTNQQYL